MTTATINGKPSVYLTPEMPTTINPDYKTRIADVISIATEMAVDVDAETDWLNDPETIAELNAWYDSLYNTPEAQAELDAWVTEQERIELERQETERAVHLCDAFDPVAWELASLGIAALHAIAGHDAVWQAGGQI